MPFWDTKSLRLWHGTTVPAAQAIIGEGPSVTASRDSLDFGRGFYLTTRQSQAISWARRQALRRGEEPAVVEWTMDYEDFSNCPKLSFAEGGSTAQDFWEFVTANRRLCSPHRSPPRGYFEVVVGPVANNYMTRQVRLDMDQISFHTETALALLNTAPMRGYAIRQ